MIVRSDAKAIIKRWLDQSTIPVLQKSLLRAGVVQLPEDSPILTIVGDVLHAIERGDYEDARRTLHKVADLFIDQIAPQNELSETQEQ